MSATTTARPRAPRRPRSRLGHAPWCREHDTLGLDELCAVTVVLDAGREVRLTRAADDDGQTVEAWLWDRRTGEALDRLPAAARDLLVVLLAGQVPA